MRDSLPIDTLLSVVSVLVVAQSSSEVPEGLMNNPVYGRPLETIFVSYGPLQWSTNFLPGCFLLLRNRQPCAREWAIISCSSLKDNL